MIPTLLQVPLAAEAGETATELASQGASGIAIGALVLAAFVILGGLSLGYLLLKKFIDSIPDKKRVDDALKAIVDQGPKLTKLTTGQDRLSSSMADLAGKMGELASVQAEILLKQAVLTDRTDRGATLASAG